MGVNLRRLLVMDWSKEETCGVVAVAWWLNGRAPDS